MLNKPRCVAFTLLLTQVAHAADVPPVEDWAEALSQLRAIQ